MTDVYLDPIAAAMPDAADHLRHLVDTGHRVFLLGDPPEALADSTSIASGATMPDEPIPGSWLITGDPQLCAERHLPMMSVLIGPRPAPSPRPAPRCDADARDLTQAVLEILGREAMG
jgi:hypothetical protein